MNKLMRRSCLTMFLAALLAPASAWPAEPADEAAPVLPEIVVTPSRSRREAASEPAAVYQLDGRKQTVQEGTRTTPDALQGIPSVMVQKTAYGQGSPYLRGFTGFRTLCLVDGIRLNNSVFRDGPNQYWNTVDPLSVRDYELVMGPGSVLYGSDAVGGVLNALPVEPPDYEGEAAWSPRLYYRGATAERSNEGRVELGARVNAHLGFVGGVSLKRFGDLEGGQDVGRQEHTGYGEQDYDGRISYYINDEWTLTVAHQTVVQDDAWRTHRTIYGTDWEGLSRGDDKVHSYDQQRDLTYARCRGEDLDGAVDGAEVTVSRHAQSEDLYRVRKDDQRDKQGFDVETWGAAVQLESDAGLGDLVYGFDWYHDEVSSYLRKYKADGSLSTVEIQGPVADDASYDLAGVFVENTMGFLDGRLDVVPGLRYTYARAEANAVKDPVTGDEISIEEDWDNVAGSLKLLVPLSEDRRHVAYGSVAQGFRAPNLSDLTRYDTARSGELETPSPDLEPEEYVSCEIGLKSRFRKLTTQASCYYTTIDKMIVRAPTGRTVDGNAEVTKKNSGQGYVQGVELSETWRFAPEWAVWAAGSLMDGRVKTYKTSDAEQEWDYVSRLMPPTAQVGLRWEAASGRFWAEASCDMAAEADKLSADDERDTQRIPPGGTPGYAVFDVRAGTKLFQHVDLTLAVENLFDQDYRIHGSGVNEPGRNFVLVAQAGF